MSALRIAAYDVVRVNACHRHALMAAAAATMDGGELIGGEPLRAFEQAFAAYCGVGHCVGVGNGLDALALALRALGVGAGDEVIVPAFTFVATWFSVSQLGARPVPVDVGDDGTINPHGIAPAITARTRAVVPVHLFGRLADMGAVLAAAGGIPVVEDAAQAHGASVGGRRAGALGVLAAFSFYPTKNLGALGDGGAVTTDDPALARLVRRLSNYGSDRKYRHEALGQNSRLDTVQAGFLAAKLPDLDAANARRRHVAVRYRAGLEGTPGLACPATGGEDMVWHQFVVRTAERDRLQADLAQDGIGTTIHYPTAPFDQPCYAGGYDRARYPVASRLAATVLSLPMADYLADDEVAAVIQSVRAALPRPARQRRRA